MAQIRPCTRSVLTTDSQSLRPIKGSAGGWAGERKSGTATGEKSFGVAGYSSNYGAFLRKLAEGTDLTELFGSLFSESAIISDGDENTVQLIRQLLTSIRFENPEEVTGFLKEQAAGQLNFLAPFLNNCVLFF